MDAHRAGGLVGLIVARLATQRGWAWVRTQLKVMARNTGDRRLRISGLKLRDASGHTVSLGNGLAGYALGQSTKIWTLPARGFAAHGSASISGESDSGPTTIAAR